MGFEYGFGFGSMHSVIPMMITIVFVIVIGVFLFSAVFGIRTWSQNNASPRLTVGAKVVTKRTDFTRYMHGNAGDATGSSGYHSSSTTRYYVTFEVESGDRMEFHISGLEYGMIAEGDVGKLSFQGTRYLSFERI